MLSHTIINSVELWSIPFSNEIEFRGPRRLAFAHLIEQFAKGRPVLGCGVWHFDIVQHIAGVWVGFYLIQNPRRRTGSDTRQQLNGPKAGHPIPRVLAPPQDTQDVFDVGCFQEFEATILHERDVAPGQFNLKLGTMVRGSEQHSLGFQWDAIFP